MSTIRLLGIALGVVFAFSLFQGLATRGRRGYGLIAGIALFAVYNAVVTETIWGDGVVMSRLAEAGWFASFSIVMAWAMAGIITMISDQPPRKLAAVMGLFTTGAFTGWVLLHETLPALDTSRGDHRLLLSAYVVHLGTLVILAALWALAISGSAVKKA